MCPVDGIKGSGIDMLFQESHFVLLMFYFELPCMHCGPAIFTCGLLSLYQKQTIVTLYVGMASSSL